MANHETHSVIAGGIESDLHIDSSKYPHPFCSLLQKRAHFDSFKHLIFIRGLLAIAHGAYFHERRSLNNFHRDRVITFEQIAE
ncbi:hypothetical protein ACXYWG_21005, partial [Escherichia coli]